jgi:hypothetical protein
MGNLDRRIEKRRRERNYRTDSSMTTFMRSIVEMMHAQPAPVINIGQPNITVTPPTVSVGDVNVHIPERKTHLHVEDMSQTEETSKEIMKEIRELLKSPVKPVYDRHGKVIGAKRVKTLDE